MNKKFIIYTKFIKIEHTLFSLPLIFAGVSLGSKSFPEIKALVLIIIAATFARTAAMTLNRMIDHKIDKLNPRTVHREIPSGKVSLFEAKIIFIISLIIYFFVASLFSLKCLLLSPIPIIIFLVYPHMKRFTVMAHFGVGLGLAGAPLAGWIAMNNFDLNVYPIILLTIFTIFWGTGFDIIYATLDEEFDKKNNLFSMPARLGKKKALNYSIIFHIISFVCLVGIYFQSLNDLLSIFFLILIGILFVLVHINRDNVELSFFKLNAVISFFVALMIIIKGIAT